MQEVYTALLLHSAKQTVSEDNIKKVMQSAGAAVDDTKIKALVASLEGQNIDELIKQAAVVAVAPAGAVAEKKEEKTAEESEKAAESASAGLSSLFG
jgi:large subunit ribosomal protein L12